MGVSKEPVRGQIAGAPVAITERIMDDWEGIRRDETRMLTACACATQLVDVAGHILKANERGREAG